MDLLGLRYFQVVARLEHVSRAAEELRVAQPSVSRTIARLESELGVPLFDRRGRQIRLNPFGVAFLRRTDRILGELDDARREIADAAGLEEGSFSVAAETLATLTAVLPEFLGRYPRVQVRLNQANAVAMVEQLMNHEVDFCLASQRLDAPELITTTLMREQVVLAVPVGHQLAQQDHVTVPELDGIPFVTTRKGYWPRTLADRLFDDVGLSPNVVCEGDEPGATAFLISAGLGVGLVPRMSMGASELAPVEWLPVHGVDCTRTLSLVWRDGAFLSAAAQRFRDLCVTIFGETGRSSRRWAEHTEDVG